MDFTVPRHVLPPSLDDDSMRHIMLPHRAESLDSLANTSSTTTTTSPACSFTTSSVSSSTNGSLVDATYEAPLDANPSSIDPPPPAKLERSDECQRSQLPTNPYMEGSPRPYMFSQSQEQPCGTKQPLSPVPDSTSLDMSSAASGGRPLARVPLPTPPATDGTPPHQLRCWHNNRVNSNTAVITTAAVATGASAAVSSTTVTSNYLPNNELTMMHGGRPVSSPFPTHTWTAAQQQGACGYTLGPSQFANPGMFRHTDMSYPHNGRWMSTTAAIQHGHPAPPPFATAHCRSFHYPHHHGHPEQHSVSYSFSSPMPSMIPSSSSPLLMDPRTEAQYSSPENPHQQKQQPHGKCSPHSPPNGLSSMDANKVVTTTPRRYKCTVCVKRFTRPSSLATHMHSHTGEVTIFPHCHLNRQKKDIYTHMYDSCYRNHSNATSKDAAVGFR